MYCERPSSAPVNSGRGDRAERSTVAIFATALISFWSQTSTASSQIPEPRENNWITYGGFSDQAHYSSLSDIRDSNVRQLGLAWWFDIRGIVRSTSTPLEVDGVLYFTSGYSILRALDATNGSLIWAYDPKVPRAAGRKLRLLWGGRGIAYWNDKVYTGTQDGRLLAVNAQTGKLVWSVSTTMPGDSRVITGPPLVFDGKVLVGHGVAEYGPVRGYVTAYDAETGKRLWRFYTVPGNPSNGFENDAMKMAAKTWHGQWWTCGGGGTVWNAMTFDADLNRVYIGTGNGTPWSAAARSPGGGDNLFVASIVALNAQNGAYVWHYQTNPAETWDYDAAEDIELADIDINGARHRVLMQASKNGFFYILDRETGKLLSAEKFAKVTWAEKVDLATGRPVEVPGARDESEKTVVWPLSNGAHTWPPMALSPKGPLVYIPVIDRSAEFSEQLLEDETMGTGEFIRKALSGSLLAWNPIERRTVWRISQPGSWSSGVAATAGNLVFQGRADGRFVAYASDSGEHLWSFDSQAGIAGAPITYKVRGEQYVSVMAGFSGLGASFGSNWNARTQTRRLFTFKLNSRKQLPPEPQFHEVVPVDDQDFKRNPRAEVKGAGIWFSRCALCHGYDAIAGGAAPDLRESTAILTSSAFENVLSRGALVDLGMPRFEELGRTDLQSLRQYLRARAKGLRINSTENVQNYTSACSMDQSGTPKSSRSGN